MGSREDPQDDRRPRLTPDARERLGTVLREIYDEILEAPLPERFAALIAELEAKTHEDSQ